MNREIKFRAWDKISNEWTTSGMFVGNKSKVFGINEHERIIIMQYTGLKDKNGKEIYEGDIVTGKNKDNEFGHKGKVEYLDKTASFAINVGPQLLDDDRDYYTWFSYITDSEIIGNIYENPELLPPN